MVLNISDSDKVINPYNIVRELSGVHHPTSCEEIIMGSISRRIKEALGKDVDVINEVGGSKLDIFKDCSVLAEKYAYASDVLEYSLVHTQAEGVSEEGLVALSILFKRTTHGRKTWGVWSSVLSGVSKRLVPDVKEVLNIIRIVGYSFYTPLSLSLHKREYVADAFEELVCDREVYCVGENNFLCVKDRSCLEEDIPRFL